MEYFFSVSHGLSILLLVSLYFNKPFNAAIDMGYSTQFTAYCLEL